MFGPTMAVRSYLREGTVVPEITLVREAVADETKLALLDILLDGVQEPTLISNLPPHTD
jgi:hypothetical protein